MLPQKATRAALWYGLVFRATLARFIFRHFYAGIVGGGECREARFKSASFCHFGLPIIARSNAAMILAGYAARW